MNIQSQFEPSKRLVWEESRTRNRNQAKMHMIQIRRGSGDLESRKWLFLSENESAFWWPFRSVVGPQLAKKVCSVGLRSYLEVVSVAKSIKRVVLLARKSLMNQPICFYYVSLRIRILACGKWRQVGKIPKAHMRRLKKWSIKAWD